MTKRVLLVTLVTLVAAVATAPGATAKGLGASVHGATVSGLPYRYVAISPNSPYMAGSDRPADKFTVVERIDKQGGRVGRWWYLRGRYSIPAAAYDDSAGGLSADGGTLVLSRFSWIYPPRSTGLAILDTRLHLRHPSKDGKRPPQHAIHRVNLPGSFSFDAISPDGSTAYLIQHLSPVFGGAYQVRALDTKRGKLLPEPIVDPDEPMERMEGMPVSRATSPDGRWAYTLYAGQERGRWDRAHEPFIHALDTVGRRAVCIDLPQLEGARNLFMLGLRIQGHDRQLTVLRRRPALEKPGMTPRPPLLTVNTTSFEVREPTAPQADRSSDGMPWLPIGVVGVAAIALAWIAGRRRKATGRRPLEGA